MTRKDIIIMSAGEVRRHVVISQLLEGRIKQKEASKLLGLSSRQIRRLSRRVQEEGVKGIAHRSRGKPGNRSKGKSFRKRVLDIYSDRYHDFGPTLASEKLEELEGIKINHETLRNWLLQEEKNHCWVRKARPHRKWREPRRYYGEMLQMDGSHHDWLEGRGPKLVLMGYIDDATGKVFGRFYDYEGTVPAMSCIYEYIIANGVPNSIYLDNHGTYKSNNKKTVKDELLNKICLTQFGRAAEELGIRLNYAGSPQAKGRVERLFQTLQDRLVKELRLAKACSLEEANKLIVEYLPKFNVKFTKQAKKKGNLHGKRPDKRTLDRILSIQEQRVLQKDSTIRYNNKYYLVLDRVSKHIKRVTVEDRLDGSVHIRYDDEYLKIKEIDKDLIYRSLEEEAKEEKQLKANKGKYIPPRNHNWRHWRIRKAPVYLKEKAG